MTTIRGQVIEEGGRANVYAVEPKVYVDSSAQAGFTPYAERLNGRLAMIGFVSLLALEVLSRHGVVGWLSHL
ncbi:high light inducible protein [Leptolyngbya sp. 'hensonii']|uniref:high light inducible protein n=1 Tax=Leptolyngbya sp. 'hensonii' TaxID=1922337 RepID=UPI00094F8976|nr:high light inducible protein [Leptolyngbya sp. 'hensonii']OLP15901.1 high light inducible protein [Leptolyngbya sp. 'hensonii']